MEVIEMMNRKKAIVLLAGGLVAGCGGGQAGRNTYFAYTSDPGDFIGKGQTRRFNQNEFYWQPYFDESGSYIGISLNSVTNTTPLSWLLEFSGADSAALTVGTYSLAERWPFQSVGHPGMNIINGESPGSNTLSGNFTIHELDIENKIIRRLLITFELHADEKIPALRGELSIVNPIA
jgi:hypothetical protein